MMNETTLTNAIGDDRGITVPESEVIAVNIAMKGQAESQTFDVGDLYMHATGCIVSFDVKIKDVHPNKRVALGVILTEVDSLGAEHPRGVKALTVPAHNESACCDIAVRNIRFVLPDDLNVSAQNAEKLCCYRNLRVRTVVHHIDSECTFSG